MLPNNDIPNDSLIDWTSPSIERQSSRPLIPLPTFTSPLDEIDVDNPFDAVERQITDGTCLDLLNVSSLFGSSASSSNHSQYERSFTDEPYTNLLNLENENSSAPKCEILIQIEDVDEEKELDDEILAPISVEESLKIREQVANRISSCINQALKKSTSDMLRKRIVTPVSSLESSIPLNDGFLLTGSKEQEWGRERSRSMEFSLNAFDKEEDLRLMTMPAWYDEVSSSDEESPSKKLSRSLPLEGTKSWECTPSRRQRIINADYLREPLTTNNANNLITRREQILLKNGSLKTAVSVVDLKKQQERKSSTSFISDNLLANPKLLDSRTDRATSTLVMSELIKNSKSVSKQKQWCAPIASSTPLTRRPGPGETNTRTLLRGRTSSIQQGSKSRTPSPDSTSNGKCIREAKVASKNRSVKATPTRKNLNLSKKVNYLKTPVTSKSLKNKDDKENRALRFKT